MNSADISMDMRFGFEVRDKRLTLYERVELEDIKGQDGCREVLSVAAQVSYTDRLEDALQAAFNRIEFLPEADNFLAHDLQTGKQYFGVYDPKAGSITHLERSDRPFILF